MIFLYSKGVQNSSKLIVMESKVWARLWNSKHFERKNRLQSKPEKGVCKNSVFLGKSTCLIQWNFADFQTNFVIFEPTCILEYTLKIIFFSELSKVDRRHLPKAKHSCFAERFLISNFLREIDCTKRKFSEPSS